jgi:hypothetical protein
MICVPLLALCVLALNRQDDYPNVNIGSLIGEKKEVLESQLGAGTPQGFDSDHGGSVVYRVGSGKFYAIYRKTPAGFVATDLRLDFRTRQNPTDAVGMLRRYNIEPRGFRNTYLYWGDGNIIKLQQRLNTSARAWQVVLESIEGEKYGTCQIKVTKQMPDDGSTWVIVWASQKEDDGSAAVTDLEFGAPHLVYDGTHHVKIALPVFAKGGAHFGGAVGIFEGSSQVGTLTCNANLTADRWSSVGEVQIGTALGVRRSLEARVGTGSTRVQSKTLLAVIGRFSPYFHGWPFRNDATSFPGSAWNLAENIVDGLCSGMCGLARSEFLLTHVIPNDAPPNARTVANIVASHIAMNGSNAMRSLNSRMGGYSSNEDSVRGESNKVFNNLPLTCAVRLGPQKSSSSGCHMVLVVAGFRSNRLISEGSPPFEAQGIVFYAYNPNYPREYWPMFVNLGSGLFACSMSEYHAFGLVDAQ